jgi:hypothetical protein
VVVTEPTPGPHRLRVAVTQPTHSGEEVGVTVETTAWTINFTFENTGGVPPPNRIIRVEPARSMSPDENL